MIYVGEDTTLLRLQTVLSNWLESEAIDTQRFYSSASVTDFIDGTGEKLDHDKVNAAIAQARGGAS